MSINKAFFIVAALVFALDYFGVHVGPGAMESIGLALLAIGLAV